ncbi:protein kinase [Nonomuraea sp. NPDC049637]|uniref:serine/threonine protein kinase n=1 Tax=Nonomuraea sp. NPDC049637 TaxID=3154356 RepID=UPI00341CA25E
MVEKDSPQAAVPERIGDHEIVSLLGQGPRGAVHLGKESEDADPVAIKTLTVDPAADPDFVTRLKDVSRVSSSYVARTLDAGVQDGLLYVVREHVEGRSLAETVAADGPLTGDALERVAVGMLTALTAVHLAGFAHRGLTPSNVILTGEGLRVTDIEIGDPAGEIGYRAPEQLNGLQYGPYADVFAWAATVVFAATGSAPFGQDAHAVLTDEPVVDGLPDPLRQTVLAALSKDVSGRPTTYTALLRLLGDDKAPMPAAPIDGVLMQMPSSPMPPSQLPPSDPADLVTMVDGQPPVPGQPPLPGQPPVPGGPPVLPLAIEGAPIPNGPMHPGPMANGPIPNGPIPNGPMPNGPVPNGPVPNGPVPNGPMANGPVPNGPMAHDPMQPGPFLPGVPPQGPMGHEPMQPAPMQPAPMQHLPMDDEPVQGVPVQYPPVPVQAAWGPPPGPQNPSAEPAQPAMAGAGSTGPARKPFPIGLVAGVVAVMLLSAIGLWGASRYSSNVTFEPAAAAGSASPTSGAAAAAQKAVTAVPTQPQAEVTAPWATTPSPDDDGVGPLVLNDDTSADPPQVPVLTTVPTPTAAQQLTVPTIQPTVQERKTTKEPEPTATVTRTVTPTPSATQTQQPTETPTQRPNGKPTQKPSETPTPSPTASGTTTATQTAIPTASQQPTQTQKPTQQPTQTQKPTQKPTQEPEPTEEPEPTPTAKPNPYTPTQVCGSGFVVQRSTSYTGGATYQLYNNSTGQNCVVTLKSGPDVGKATPVSATLEVQGGPSNTDRGNYEYYAGPVKLLAKGKCVRYSGSAGIGNTQVDWANCG